MLKVDGKITNILAIESGVSKADKPWKKQSFVIDTGAQYNPEVCFSLFGEEKLEMLNKYKQGDSVSVLFNVSSREFNGKYYHNLDAWKIDALEGQAETVAKIDNAPAADDDLPF